MVSLRSRHLRRACLNDLLNSKLEIIGQHCILDLCVNDHTLVSYDIPFCQNSAPFLRINYSSYDNAAPSALDWAGGSTPKDCGRGFFQYSFPQSSVPASMPQSNIIVIEQTGDVVLHFKDVNAGLDQEFQCSRRHLRQNSPYFDALLDPKKFSEGKEVEISLQTLSKSYGAVTSAPLIQLPVVTIREIGNNQTECDLSLTALHLFLKFLHRQSADDLKEGKAYPHKGFTLVTMLALLADRFAATDIIRQHIQNEELYIFKDRTKDRLNPKLNEISHRQKLLAGTILDFPGWVRQSSAALICAGSDRWVHDDENGGASGITNCNYPLWYKLPHGLEEELQCRRDYVLETISTLPSFFIGLYSSKQQQCKLGYDTSPQCDSFQLGEMVRFFTRKGLLRLQSTFSPGEDQPSYADDVTKVVDTLRQCPSYQLDANHRHCGLRTRILPVLDALRPLQQVGICLKCWKDNQCQESWLNNPTGGSWSFSEPEHPLIWRGECVQHGKLKAMYTAEHRNWTAPRS